MLVVKQYIKLLDQYDINPWEKHVASVAEIER